MDPEDAPVFYTGPDGEQYDTYGEADDAWEREEEYAQQRAYDEEDETEEEGGER